MATGGAGDQHWRTDPAIHKDCAVEFTINRAAALHKHLPHHLPFDACLNRDQRIAQEPLGDSGCVGGGLGEFHAPLRRTLDHSLAASAGMDLGLDCADGSAKHRERCGGLFGRPHYFPGQHRHASGTQ